MRKPLTSFKIISLFIAAIFFSVFSKFTMTYAIEPAYPLLEDFQLPKSLSLCGEPIPLENQVVREMLDREFIISVWDRAQVFLWLKRASRYFPLIEKKLAEAGLPDDLKYVAVAESSLLTYTESEKGATGPWQFMLPTGRHNGLRKERMLDERLNIELATDAAIKHFKHLKGIFVSWTLAIAAYNCGENRLKREMKEQRVVDYYRLNLPLETERYVFRIAAIKILFQNPTRYGYNLSKNGKYLPIECDTVKIDMPSSLSITDVAQAGGTDFKAIKELNPQLVGNYFPSGLYSIKVPPGLGHKIIDVIKKSSKRDSLRMGKVTVNYYIVKSGDTLSHIAKKTGTSVKALKDLNGLSNSHIRKGQKLRLGP
jgi:LysM repeat protein